MKVIPIYIAAALTLIALSLTPGCGSGNKGEETADSLFSVANINSISVNEPYRAMVLIDSAEQGGKMNDYDLCRARALVYHNGFSDNIKSLHYAQKAYDTRPADKIDKSYIHLLEMLADLYYINGDYPRSIKLCTEGIKLSHDSAIANSEANLNTIFGKDLIALQRKDEGFEYFQKAIDILDRELKKDGTWETADDYAYTLLIYMGALRDENGIDEAIGLLPRADEVISRLGKAENLPDGLADMRQANMYALAAHLFALKGEKEKADMQYRKFQTTDYSTTQDAPQLIVPYLIDSRNYDEALRQLQESKEFWQANNDTVSYGYINYILDNQLSVFEATGNIREANRVLHRIHELNDTLRQRDRDEKALEFAEIYKTTEQSVQIQRQSASILLRNVIIASALVAILLTVFLLVRSLRHNRIIRKKNTAIVNTINELLRYKDRMIELEQELLGYRSTDIDTPEHTEPETQPEALENMSEITLTEGDRALYERMNQEILTRHLFLNEDFSKASLVAEFRVPSYKFAALFKKFAGCSFSQYIHNCRLEYAVKLMRENPDWTLQAIAEASCMSQSSFYTQFRKKFGMSPSDYRTNEASGDS